MNTMSLSATRRTATGKGAARKLRRAGQLPGVIYSGGRPASPVAVDPAALDRIFRHTGNANTLIEVDVEGDKHLCLVREIQRHPVSKVARHVDFYEVDAEVPVTVNVPVRTRGVAEGTKMGGTLRLVRRTLRVRARPQDIPEAIEVDVTSMQVGDFIRVSAIEAPEGCEILYKSDFNVVTVFGKRGGVVAAEAAEESEEAEA